VSDGFPSLPDPEFTLEIAPAAVAEWIHLPAGKRPCLIDCREPDELAICRIDGHEWVPLGSFPASLDKLRDGGERGVVVYCHHGMRSLRAASFLRAHGVENAFSMSGGIDAWSAFIDPLVARY
jgi:rhodanese-related sulfurtransferase